MLESGRGLLHSKTLRDDGSERTSKGLGLRQSSAAFRVPAFDTLRART